MGMFDWLGPVGAVLNPVGLFANAFAGGLDYLAGEKDRGAAATANENNVQLAREQMAMQRQFAQMGVQWRVEDARKAGISPLAALGASTSGYNPVSVHQEAVPAGNSLRALGNMGQNISRAVLAAATPAERAKEALEINRLNVETKLLDEQVVHQQLLNSQLAAEQSVGPPMPVPGSQTISLMREGDGLVPVPSKEWNEANGGNLLSQVGWSLRNRLIPSVPFVPRDQYPQRLDPNRFPGPGGRRDGYWEFYPISGRYHWKFNSN